MSDASDEVHQNPFRRHHKKSRFGCRNCKQRRIKCDEVKPECGNCIRRKVNCDFASGLSSSRSPDPHGSRPQKLPILPASSSRSTGDFSDGSFEGHAVDYSQALPDAEPEAYSVWDLKLLHHYSCVTSHAMRLDDSDYFWQMRVPDAGFASPAIMHMTLALAAAHRLAVVHAPADTDVLQFHSERHAVHAARIMNQYVTCAARADSIRIASAMAGLHLLARGPFPGDYLSFADHGDPIHASRLRELRTLHRMRALSDEMATFYVSTEAFDLGDSRSLPRGESVGSDAQPSTNVLTKDILEYKMHFFRLWEIIERGSSGESELSVIAEAFRQLQAAFKRHFGPHDEPRPAGGEDLLHALDWLMGLSDDFLRMLQDKHPCALIVFAHYAILLWQYRHRWPFGGWAEHILAGTYRNIDLANRKWLVWPVAYLGWSAPGPETSF